MNFAIIKEHRDFFRKHRWIEFEGLLTKDQKENLLKESTAVLSKRLKAQAADIFQSPADKLFNAGRDLWRDSSKLKKIILGKSLAEAASELIEKKPLRFGYDQLFPSPKLSVEEDSYSKFLTEDLTLQEISCIQGVLCGLMLCIVEPTVSSSETPLEKSAVFSSRAGNGVIFAPDMPIPLKELNHRPGAVYLLLVYADVNAVYCLEEKDYHTHHFKRWGYHFGDRLSEILNPLVYK